MSKKQFFLSFPVSDHPFQNQNVPNGLYVVISYHLSTQLTVKTNQTHGLQHAIVVFDDCYDFGVHTGHQIDVLGVFFGDIHILVHSFLSVYDGKNIVNMNFDYVETVLIDILNHVIQIDMIVHGWPVLLDCIPVSSLGRSYALRDHNGFHKTEILRIVYFFFCA